MFRNHMFVNLNALSPYGSNDDGSKLVYKPVTTGNTLEIVGKDASANWRVAVPNGFN
ncbi:unnamed protein product, partial [Didymodactylos carnosus]